MRKPTFCIGESKDADQLRGNREADQRLCFLYTDSTIPLLSNLKFQASSHLLKLYSLVCVGPGRKPERWFSHDEAHLCLRMVRRHIFNRAYPENTNFETFVPGNLKFHTVGDLHTTKKCYKFELDILSSLRVIAIQKYNKHIAKCRECT